MNKYVLANQGAYAAVYYWYQGRGRIESNEYTVKYNLMHDAALYGRTEEALVRIVVPLMTAQDRARSVAALRAAPRVVVQIVEDTLAQTGAEQIELAGNPLTRAWQAEALTACLGATEGRFPFADGADADISSVSTAFAPNGVIERFFKMRVEALIDTSDTPWRWKPEARFAGVTPDSALFFQKAQAITAGLYGSTGKLGTRPANSVANFQKWPRLARPVRQ